MDNKYKMAAYLETPRFEQNVTIFSPVEIPSDNIQIATNALLHRFIEIQDGGQFGNSNI